MTNRKHDNKGLRPDSNALLADLEKLIITGQETFFESCRAMRSIVENKLYKSRHRSLEAYVKAQFGMSRSRANQLVDCDRVMENLSTKVDKNSLPKNERQIRPLVKLPLDEQLEYWLSGGDNSSRSKPKADRGERLFNYLLKNYHSLPDEEKPVFITEVEELMVDLKNDLQAAGPEN
ncbi:MAG: hypothetical protein ACI9VS_000955 [Candidatus Binatia bacterium]|jgi:hypothetical protein